jgi:hypothetical protein
MRKLFFRRECPLSFVIFHDKRVLVDHGDHVAIHHAIPPHLADTKQDDV